MLVVFTFKAVGQQLPKGTFILSTGFTYTEFTLKNKSKFNYKYSSCTGGQEGRGTFTFKNKELLLTFDNPRNKSLPALPVIVKRKTQNDTLVLLFKFSDARDTNSVSGVVAKFVSKSNGKTYGTQSNERGQARLKVAKEEFPLEVEIDYIGIAPKTIKLDTSADYSIAFPLNFEFIQPLVYGDTLSFIIDNFNEEELVLKPVNEKEFRVFKRK